MSIKCSHRITSNVGKGCRHPDGCFMLLALTSAVQPSKASTRLQSHIIHPSEPCNLISLGSLRSNAHTIPPHACPHILHPWLTTYTHTHQHSQHYAPTVSHIPMQHVLHTDALSYICIYIYTEHTYVAHLHINTQHMHTHKT